MYADLKPCPFCGSRDVEVFEDNKGCWYVMCNSCDNHFTSTEGAVLHWNNRVADKNVLDVLKNCYAYLCVAQLWKARTGLLTDEEDKLISQLEDLLKEIDPEAKRYEQAHS